MGFDVAECMVCACASQRMCESRPPTDATKRVRVATSRAQLLMAMLSHAAHLRSQHLRGFRLPPRARVLYLLLELLARLQVLCTRTAAQRTRRRALTRGAR